MNIYEKYSFIRSKIKDLEKEMEELEPQILEEIKSLSAPMKTTFGTFTTQVRATWKYSEEIAKKEEKLSLRFIEIKK